MGEERRSLGGAPGVPVHQERCCDEDRRICPQRDADHEGQYEPHDRRAAEKEQRRQHDQRGNTGVTRPLQCLIDRGVGRHREGLSAAFQQQIVADAIEDHDGVVHRVAENSEECGDKECVKLHAGGVTENDEDADGDQKIVQECRHCSDAEAPRTVASRNRAESPCEIHNDADGGDDEGKESPALQCGADRGPDGGVLHLANITDVFLQMREELTVRGIIQAACSHEGMTALEHVDTGAERPVLE